MRLVPIACLLCSVAAADPARVAAFRKAADRAARARGEQLIDLHTADLDGDGRDDLVAKSTTRADFGADEAGTLFLESADRQRAAFAYTRLSNGNEDAAPRAPTATQDKTASIDVGYKRESEATLIALRDHAYVVVHQHESDFHIPDYFTDCDVDWTTLVREASDGDFNEDSKDEAPKEHFAHRRREAVLLLGESTVATDTQIVRGKEAWTGPADAALRVHAREVAGRLVVDLVIDDDARVLATARTDAALDAADHVAVWVGEHALRLARDASGWFVLGTNAVKAKVTSAGDGTLSLDVPIAWAVLQKSGLGTADLCGSEEEGDSDPEEVHGRTGSLVVAFADVDVVGGPRTVVSTAPVPKRGDPRGLLVALPHGARWLRETTDVKHVPFR